MISAKRIWYQAAKSGLRGPLTRVRHWGLDPNDAFIASYPRSGNTWLRFVLFDVLVRGQESGFDRVNRIIAEVGLHQPAIPLLPGDGRLIKTHEPFQKQYGKAIYLVRDVRDVVLSEFAYQQALDWVPNDFPLFLERFLGGEVNPFTPWHQHVPGWIDSALGHSDRFLLIKFEDLRHDTARTVERVLDFLGLVVDPQAVREAVAGNTVERMQKKEERSPQLSNVAPRGAGSVETRFIRKGAVGGWRDRLTPHQVAMIEEKAAPVLARLGYPLEQAQDSEREIDASLPQAVGQR